MDDAPDQEPGGAEAVPEDVRRGAVAQVARARRETVTLIASLTRLWDELVASAEQSNIDDEHDPEGATVAWERAQLDASLSRARADLDALDQAAERLRTGAFWTCESCGDAIPPARLQARPTTRLCLPCAARPRR
ncbi:TraR/DksA family transcriptional regulator [Actinocorallia sp. API 0066]|uniref:TraR/DksA family transcriptional regulator n=1 Tax=Actinocorallia sp. API 0066 TaxID=2896846 RepID=UPI001E390670|nr:TraR/DksA family transcriptional regulator [Actinocorallia sp. API 0066]MCD0452921.1 TraR/DksA family transcriptional regulator [Actinocorallia sp. API 0066]